MNTTAHPHTHRPAARRSEGADSVERLLADTRRGQMPQPYLLTPAPDSALVQANTGKRPPLRLIKTRERASVCGFSVCALSPECTNQCRYREADEALRGHYNSRHTQRQAMPPLPVDDHSIEYVDRTTERWILGGLLALFALLITAPFLAAAMFAGH